MFAIFITHTSFQLYHCEFPREYLKEIHDTGDIEKYKAGVKSRKVTSSGTVEEEGTVSEEEGIKLSSTKLYDFCDPLERGEWLDILIALIEYLRSGESKVGFLNRSLEKNMLNKAEGVMEEGDGVVEMGDMIVVADLGEIPGGNTGIPKRKEEDGGKENDGVAGDTTLRRSSRKRELEQGGRDTKVRRKT
jgi:hypothetical protein